MYIFKYSQLSSNCSEKHKKGLSGIKGRLKNNEDH